MKKGTKALALLLGITLTGCAPYQMIKDKVNPPKEKVYTWDIYYGQFSAKSYIEKSGKGLEVLAAKYEDHQKYNNSPEIANDKRPTREIDNAWEIFIKDGEEFIRVTDNNVRDYSPDISANERYIAFERFDENYSTSEIYKVDLHTGQETKMTNQEHARKPKISPEGEIVAYNIGTEIWITDKNGQKNKKIIEKGKLYDWTDEGIIFHDEDKQFPDRVFDIKEQKIKEYKNPLFNS